MFIFIDKKQTETRLLNSIPQKKSRGCRRWARPHTKRMSHVTSIKEIRKMKIVNEMIDCI